MPAINLLIKPASGNCNMRCKYCFYADEIKNREIPSYGIMTQETLEIIIKKVLEYTTTDCSIAFQGGEPTLVGINFYKKLLDITYQYKKPNINILFSIQTNGYIIDDEWARFFADNNFLVGISLDGNKVIHDRYRVDKKGEGTFNKVINTIGLFEKYKVEYNVLTVVNGPSSYKARKIYNYFAKLGINYQQYIECLDPFNERAKHEYSLTSKEYSNFLKDMFDMWYIDMKNNKYVYNRYFENLMMIIAGYEPESCNMRGICGKQWVIEADGSVFPCDFYVLDKWKLGNFTTDSIEDMDKVRLEKKFIEESMYLNDECRQCQYYRYCRNGCKRLCEPIEKGQRQKNCYCESYKNFFDYALPRLKEMYVMYSLSKR